MARRGLAASAVLAYAVAAQAVLVPADVQLNHGRLPPADYAGCAFFYAAAAAAYYLAWLAPGGSHVRFGRLAEDGGLTGNPAADYRGDLSG